jgi:hypothetical protein
MNPSKSKLGSALLLLSLGLLVSVRAVALEPPIELIDESPWILWARWSTFVAGASDPIQMRDVPDYQAWPSRATCEEQIPAMRDIKYFLLSSEKVSEATKGPTGVAWWNIGHTRFTTVSWQCLPEGQLPQK